MNLKKYFMDKLNIKTKEDEDSPWQEPDPTTVDEKTKLLSRSKTKAETKKMEKTTAKEKLKKFKSEADLEAAKIKLEMEKTFENAKSDKGSTISRAKTLASQALETSNVISDRMPGLHLNVHSFPMKIIRLTSLIIMVISMLIGAFSIPNPVSIFLIANSLIHFDYLRRTRRWEP